MKRYNRILSLVIVLAVIIGVPISVRAYRCMRLEKYFMAQYSGYIDIQDFDVQKAFGHIQASCNGISFNIYTNFRQWTDNFAEHYVSADYARRIEEELNNHSPLPLSGVGVECYAIIKPAQINAADHLFWLGAYFDDSVTSIDEIDATVKKLFDVVKNTGLKNMDSILAYSSLIPGDVKVKQYIKESEKIAGKLFGTTTRNTIKTSDDVDSVFELRDLSFDGYNVTLKGTAIHPNGGIYMNVTGKVYQATNTEKAIVCVFDKHKECEFLSFVIESEPNIKALQQNTKTTIEELPEERKNNPVIKIALKLSSSGELVYFEDVLDSVDITEALRDALPVADLNIRDIVAPQETWFLFFD